MHRSLAWIFVLGCSCAPRIQVTSGQTLVLDAHDLKAIPAAELKGRIHQDAEALRDVLAGLDALQERAQRLDRALDRGDRGYYTQEENEHIRALLLSYLNHRTALLRMVAFHSGFRGIPSERERVQSFLVGYTAALGLSEKGAVLVALFRDAAEVRRKLNEAEPVWGIPPDSFETIYANLVRPANLLLLAEAGEEYARLTPAAEALGVLADPRFAWMPDEIARRLDALKRHAPSLWEGGWDVSLARMRRTAGAVTYDVQSALATWAGDTRVSFAPPAVPVKALRELERELQPGDIVLTRRDYYVSNGFLPGFWPHALLYVGSAEQLMKSGLHLRPAVARHLARYREPAKDGNPLRVIEAISEGVVFSSLEEALGADHLAVLRPRVSEARKLAAIERAFAHYGKRYDFDFDFFSTDKLVCTELVYRSYDEPLGGERLNLTLIRMMGRDTYPAIELIRKFAREWARDRSSSGPPSRELDFVAYLSGSTRRTAEDLIRAAE